MLAHFTFSIFTLNLDSAKLSGLEFYSLKYCVNLEELNVGLAFTIQMFYIVYSF